VPDPPQPAPADLGHLEEPGLRERAGADPRQALSAACAVLIAFQGVCHEVVGATLFPYGPALFGGPVGWHAFGFLIVAVGLGLLLAVLSGARRLAIGIAAPLIPLAVAVFLIAGIGHGDFHLFALTGLLSATGLVVCQSFPRKE
jgi:hypothetical protein